MVLVRSYISLSDSSLAERESKTLNATISGKTWVEALSVQSAEQDVPSIDPYCFEKQTLCFGRTQICLYVLFLTRDRTQNI